ncbi:CHRD domain-containing protein [Streptomyces sp. H27-D2]|uniref:CHRD domain-containing protein n=1 Tax=Streptomyces sp. H27-D2 TaxID=3046304 RepID=UPI002DBA06EA|nr:CHRD domain-containing protein [Streptomyces sp. H27-D2]MEC4015085.1 CHRD domain-containing protein [Streptomyces sp. H27-D2]
MRSINWRTENRRTTVLVGATAVAATAGLALTVLPAFADSASGDNGRQGHSHAQGTSHGTAHGSTRDSGLGKLSATNQSGAAFFAGSLNGANEVPAPGGPAVGDKDGKAIAFMRVQGDEVSFAFKFRGIAAPTAAHIHQGAKGTNGAIKIPFFAKKLPDGRTSVSGTVKVGDQRLLNDLRTNPNGFYFNLHTGEFPGGAVRGQVHKLAGAIDMNKALRQNFQASVVKGSQIYACTQQPGGGYAFTQNNVSARLQRGISHSFAKPGPQGPPAWVARDRSAVTGQLISRTPNGADNIPELDLRAEQAGKKHGLLAGTDEILRLNTAGGVAPAGSCDPHKQRKVAVPYRADYLFVNGA